MIDMGAKRCLHYESSAVNQQVSVAESSTLKRKRKAKPVPSRMNFKSPPSPSSSTWIGRLRKRKNVQLTISEQALKHDCNTSDYGTASESSRKSSLAVSADEGCWDQLSGISNLTGTPLVSEDDAVSERLSAVGWSDSDSDTDVSRTNQWEDPVNTKEGRIFQTLKDENILVKMLIKDGVVVLVPRNRTSDIDYQLQIITSASYKPHLLLGTIHASHVISLEPGAKFHRFPAVIFMPLSIEPGPTDTLECLYSNTSVGMKPQWRKLPEEQFHYRWNKNGGIVVISTLHFSLFTVVIRPQPQETRRLIRQRSGGRLRNPAAPGVEVNFPRGCLQEDIVASVQVLLEDDPCESRALASPVVMVGPHGYQFSANHPPVTIRLPLPDYVQIRHKFPTQLSVWQSNTSEDEAVFWEKLEVDIRVERDPISRGYCAVFPVYHFSFFKIMWDLLSASLCQAKMGISHFYPYISFSMMCQAFMEENTDSSRFGLEVICHRSDRKLPELTNYKHRIGASLKPKLVKPGKILVRLKSQLFEADVEAGEDREMVKEEYDFRGRDFEKQFACKFKLDVKIKRGTFGKVTVERVVSGGIEPIFEFNLQKSGFENETALPNCSDRWTLVATKELAGTLRILEDQNWKSLARYLGFTRQEIKNKLQYSADPFLAMTFMYQERSGSPEEFIQALYAVSRELNINGENNGSPRIGTGSQSGGSQGGSSPTGSQNSSQNSSPMHSTKRGLWASLSPWRAKDDDSDTSGTQCTKESAPARKRVHPSSGSGNSSKGKTLSNQHKGVNLAKKPRRQYSDVSETITSSTSDEDENDEDDEDKIPQDKVSLGSQRLVAKANRKKNIPILPNALDSEDERSTEKCKRDPRMMSDGDLWRVSSSMNNINWRALGRTLGLQESALVNIESSYRTAGCRECAYQVLLEWKGLKPKQCSLGALYSALTKESMNEVAKKIAAINFENDE